MTIQEEQTLEPLRVVELGNHAGIAYCGLLLAGLGAVVSKVVETQGYPDEPVASWRGRRPVGLPRPRQAEAWRRDDVAAALAEADVVLAGLPAAELTARGWDPDTLRAQYPRLVVAKADDDPPTDLKSQASSGLMALMGEPGRPPLRLPGPQAQYGAGTVLLTGIMFALVHRARTGEGSVVSTTAARALAYLDWKSQIYYADEGRVLVRGSDAGPLVLQCSDGFVGFYYRPEEWEAVKRFVGDPLLTDERFATQRGRDQHRADLKAILEAFTGRAPRPRSTTTDRPRGSPSARCGRWPNCSTTRSTSHATSWRRFRSRASAGCGARHAVDRRRRAASGGGA